jgi:hypothetical protein
MSHYAARGRDLNELEVRKRHIKTLILAPASSCYMTTPEVDVANRHLLLVEQQPSRFYAASS